MKEFKIGGKIILEDSTVYRIIDIVLEDNMEYYFCCTTKKGVQPKVLIKKEINGKVFVKEVENQKILKKIASKILK